MQWFVMALRRTLDFSGRSRRKEYWMFYLFFVLIAIALSVLDGLIGTSVDEVGLLSALFVLAMIVPFLSLTIRRLHDTDRSGWWMFIALVPIIGGFILLYFYVSDGTPGPNRFGPNPKGV